MFSDKRGGFTLVEVLIVLGIIAATIAIGLTRFKRQDSNIRSVVRHMSVLVKEMRNRARLTNSTARLVLRMSNDGASYWVEKAQGVQKVDPNLAENKSLSDEKNPKPEPFQIDKILNKKEKVLPKGFWIGLVETINMKSPLTEGDAYIYCSPEGFLEASVIQITDRKNMTWSLVINPLTGQTDIVQEAKFLKDLNR